MHSTTTYPCNSPSLRVVTIVEVAAEPQIIVGEDRACKRGWNRGSIGAVASKYSGGLIDELWRLWKAEAEAAGLAELRVVHRGNGRGKRRAAPNGRLGPRWSAGNPTAGDYGVDGVGGEANRGQSKGRRQQERVILFSEGC